MANIVRDHKLGQVDFGHAVLSIVAGGLPAAATAFIDKHGWAIKHGTSPCPGQFESLPTPRLLPRE
eukprot:m.319308 g.319308  ORF g.319308 m.319308 type:complete len:66 (-) comp55492_c0_seq2:2324-2521(-)